MKKSDGTAKTPNSLVKLKLQKLEHLKPIFTRLHLYLPAIFFIFGFFFDIITLGRIDNLFNIISHGIYLALIIHIIILQICDYELPDNASFASFLFFTYENEILHFLLGALLNAFIIFYFKSSSLINSLALLLIMGILLIANELKIFRRQGPALKVAVLTISLISFFVYLLPIIFGKTGTLLFLASLLGAALVIVAICYILKRCHTNETRIRTQLIYPAVAIFILFPSLYFLKLIPPVPLSLKYIGIYHQVTHQNGNYKLLHQNPAWRFWANGDQAFAARPGDRIYLFTSIFSPGGFADMVYLKFEFKNKKENWQATDRIPMHIVGGRDKGFRGYAFKQNYQAGKWRAKVETANGQEIGRIGFIVHMDKETKPREFKEEMY